MTFSFSGAVVHVSVAHPETPEIDYDGQATGHSQLVTRNFSEQASPAMIRLMIIPAAVLTLFTAVAGQAAVLKGVVLGEELGGPMAAGVEIDPTEGAKPVVTDAGGAFTLVFPDKQAGDTVLLTVRSEGTVSYTHLTLPTIYSV